MIRAWSALVLVVALLTACGGPEITFRGHEDFDDTGWAYADSVNFEFPVTDTSGRFDLVLSIDHTTDFPYQNFYVNLRTHLPNGRVLSQPLSLQLANTFGEWQGECEGEACTTDIALQQGTKFTDLGNHRLVVTQFSRDETLSDVTGIGFRIVKH
ncbi:gliding motility-associated lipoprotein GldH [Lewinella aquimaris]|uniref:Gliding motility-associated lipoprotein GldH n=1 Tax=Neolewinella aquimaris TaxID=1835722 RepID=A0A840EA20_9BACT|nr:gliding motility lipoprotein GldH [Neolewinella aquimaris]MBB4078659.1 gliding motility-associated lipoprotein GldH [Neolewinella aquimaris]